MTEPDAVVRCPACRYALTGLDVADPSLRCPECGAAAGPDERVPRRRGLILGGRLAILGLCVYAPYGWLLTNGEPWSGYRAHWTMMWPVLPGLLPGHLLTAGQASTPILILLCAAFTGLMLTPFGVVVGTAERRWVLVAGWLIALALSVLNSWALYQAYRM